MHSSAKYLSVWDGKKWLARHKAKAILCLLGEERVPAVAASVEI